MTLGGALAVAARLPAGPAADLVRAARAAFTDGMHAAAPAGAVLLLAAATLVARRVPRDAAPAPRGAAPDPGAPARERPVRPALAGTAQEAVPAAPRRW